MIYISINEPQEEDWIAWRKKCATAAQKIIDDYEASGTFVVTDLYKDPEIKHKYYSGENGFFAGKCAYCESQTNVNQPGDIEHYRPKNRVTDWDENEIKLNDGKSHPGYYWLAYDSSNLLFSCADCNRVSKKKVGRRIGKWDYFPVNGQRAIKPGEENVEKPLLINPIAVDPSIHLKFDEAGIVEHLSAEGEECIKVFGLDCRESLLKGRSDAYRDAISVFKLAYLAKVLNGEETGAQIKIDEITEGTSPYAAAARSGLNKARKDAHGAVDSI